MSNGSHYLQSGKLSGIKKIIVPYVQVQILSKSSPFSLFYLFPYFSYKPKISSIQRFSPQNVTTIGIYNGER